MPDENEIENGKPRHDLLAKPQFDEVIANEHGHLYDEYPMEIARNVSREEFDLNDINCPTFP